MKLFICQFKVVILGINTESMITSEYHVECYRWINNNFNV